MARAGLSDRTDPDFRTCTYEMSDVSASCKMMLDHAIFRALPRPLPLACAKCKHSKEERNRVCVRHGAL